MGSLLVANQDLHKSCQCTLAYLLRHKNMSNMASLLSCDFCQNKYVQHEVPMSA